MASIESRLRRLEKMADKRKKEIEDASAEIRPLSRSMSRIKTYAGKCDEVKCPVCGFEYNHMGEPKTINGNDNGEAGWWGRGDLVVIPVEGECGCLWEICFGFHKGSIYSFSRVLSECEED